MQVNRKDRKEKIWRTISTQARISPAQNEHSTTESVKMTLIGFLYF